jgi:hypothetical protein
MRLDWSMLHNVLVQFLHVNQRLRRIVQAVHMRALLVDFSQIVGV